jgi:hydroxymethylpyrimidine pyrophosphatase-like HAD family hydrolase
MQAGRGTAHAVCPTVVVSATASRPADVAPRRAAPLPRHLALCCDYDGTIAHDGVVDEVTMDALRRARAAGIRLVLVTGRELTDLFNTFSGVDVFDRVVAENGAVLYEPATKAVHLLATAPPQPLIERLTDIPLSVGHSIVATVEPHEHRVLAAIRDLERRR